MVNKNEAKINHKSKSKHYTHTYQVVSNQPKYLTPSTEHKLFAIAMLYHVPKCKFDMYGSF